MVFGVLCFVGAFALTCYNLLDAYAAGRRSTIVAQKIAQEITDSGITEVSQRETPTIEIDGVQYIGFLELPKLSLTLPVAAEYTIEQLSKSPALYSGTFTSADSVIAAHNYVTHFGRLRRLEVGDELIFTDAAGRKYEYTVGWIENVLPSDSEHMIKKNGWELTLFTCNYDKSVRYTVRCIQKK